MGFDEESDGRKAQAQKINSRGIIGVDHSSYRLEDYIEFLGFRRVLMYTSSLCLFVFVDRATS